MPVQNWQDIYYTSHDGLRLYARYYPAPASRRRPVLCLPGLTRNSRDFHALACFLADPHNPRARDVIAVDYRGRGRSQWDARWRSYAMSNEMLDALDLLTIGGLSDVAVVGTSRGGLIAMMMACVRPTVIGTVVLNDIGPVLEREGLVRMIAYVGRVPLPTNWQEATELVRDINIKMFPAVPEADWPEIARQWFNDDHGQPSPGYDPMLGRSMSLIDGPAPVLWPQFQALARVPIMAIRGELSDLLSEDTFNEMRHRHPAMETVKVRGQGHAPLLRDRSTLVAIDDFIARHDRVADVGPDRQRMTA
ncbi:MAG: alpha/beta fold hydrolase [Hyphomicrobiaceae bacterium]